MSCPRPNPCDRTAEARSLACLDRFEFGPSYLLYLKNQDRPRYMPSFNEAVALVRNIFSAQTTYVPRVLLGQSYGAGSTAFRRPAHSDEIEAGPLGDMFAQQPFGSANKRVLIVEALEMPYWDLELGVACYAKKANEAADQILALVSLYNLTGSWDNGLKANL